MSMTVALLDRLVAFPTVSRGSNLSLIAFVQEFLQARGFEVRRVTDDSGQKAGLFARLGPADRPGIMLSAHSDVVPVDGQDWCRDAFVLRQEGSRLYGRGATDMKGFLAAMLALADRAQGKELAEPLKFAISWDEEVGCIGIPQMLPHLADTIGKPRLCIVGEPTSMQIALGHKGKVALRAVCHGRGGHSAQAPLRLNALHMATDFVAGLRGLQADLAETGLRDDDYDVAYATVHVGRLSGGTALNIVPDRAEIDFEFRYVAGQSPASIERAIRDLAAAIALPLRTTFHDAEIEVEVRNAYPGLGTLPDSEAAAFVQGILPDAPLIKVAYGTEAGHFDAAGISTVVCGPGSMAQGHIANEFIEMDQLAACDAMLDRVLGAVLV